MVVINGPCTLSVAPRMTDGAAVLLLKHAFLVFQGDTVSALQMRISTALGCAMGLAVYITTVTWKTPSKGLSATITTNGELIPQLLFVTVLASLNQHLE